MRLWQEGLCGFGTAFFDKLLAGACSNELGFSCGKKQKKIAVNRSPD